MRSFGEPNIPARLMDLARDDCGDGIGRLIAYAMRTTSNPSHCASAWYSFTLTARTS
jgi:hypothetical protein